MKRILIVIAVLLALGLALMALGRRNLQHGAVKLPSDDPRMLAAVQQARGTVDEFIRRLRQPTPGQTSAAVKVRLEERGLVEHAWLAEPRFEGGQFVGRLDNDLIDIRLWRAGDTVQAPMERLSDWLVIDSGRLIGGYSIRLLRSLMSPEEQQDFDRSVGFVIDS